MLWGYRFQEQDLLAMRGQELSLHENRQWVWGEQYVLGALVLQRQQLYYGHQWGEMEWVFLYMVGLKPSKNIQKSEEIKQIRYLFNLL